MSTNAIGRENLQPQLYTLPFIQNMYFRRFEDEENFDEGAKAMNSTLTTTRVPPRIRDFLASSEFAAKSLTPSSTQFWILLKTLEKYLRHPDSEGLLRWDV